jgi:hypothetical protein
MNRLLCTAFCCIFSFAIRPALATPVLDHPLPGGYFNAEYFAGTGANTAFFVTDFGGSGGGVHGFGYHWDGTQTADNAMLAIDAAGSLDMTISNFGSAAQPNLFINRLTDLPDTDLPDFNVDSRFWHFWLGNYAASNVSWAESNFGISGRDFVTGDVVQTLTNGGFYGFYASAGSVAPRLPIAVPEPAAIILAALGFLLIACARDHKFKTAAHRLTASQTFIRT